ncbi:MAG TPA: prolyl oligopeptidase family serine peptidase, partial [Verrucomicrobiae bacterium]
GVDEMGPSNLITLLQSTPPYWTPMLGEFKKRIGDWEKEADALKARSPLFKADRIKAPLFIVQGANDPKVNQAEAEQMVQAIRKNGGRVQYLLFPDEGHGVTSPENSMKCFAAKEAFLAVHLGGRFEPASDKEKWDEFLK